MTTAESFRLLRSSLGEHGGNRPRVVVVTSSAPGEGKNVVAYGLASVLHADGEDALLVDADFYAPSLHHRLERADVDGLSDHWSSSPGPEEDSSAPRGLSNVMYKTATGITVVPAGRALASAARLYTESGVQVLKRELLSGSHRVVIVDAPPLLLASGASLIAAVADDVLLAVRLGVTREDGLTRVRELVERRGLPLLGVVLTEGEDFGPRSRSSERAALSAGETSTILQSRSKAPPAPGESY